MTTKPALLALAAVLAPWGCARSDPPPAPAAAPAPSPFGAPGPAEIVPALRMRFDKGGTMQHADVFGWSADSAEFGYCAGDGGTGGTRCAFRRPHGKTEEISDFDAGAGEPDPRKTAAIRRRLVERRYGIAPVVWPYAADLEIAWKAEGVHEGAEPGAEVLRVGARVKGAAKPVLPIVIRPKGELLVHLEAIALSPDARHLAVLSHAFAGEFTDAFEIRIAEVAELAGRAYSETGFAERRKGSYARSAELFRKAAAADPKNRPAPHNR